MRNAKICSRVLSILTIFWLTEQLAKYRECGKFYCSVERSRTKKFSASEGIRPLIPCQRFYSWTPLDPHYRLPQRFRHVSPLNYTLCPRLWATVYTGQYVGILFLAIKLNRSALLHYRVKYLVQKNRHAQELSQANCHVRLVVQTVWFFCNATRRSFSINFCPPITEVTWQNCATAAAAAAAAAARDARV